MTGPEHYREAERLLEMASVSTAQDAYREVPLDRPPSPFVEAAQVHATLALAAATAMGGDLDVPEWTAWRRVAATKRGGQ
ncbi:hypothetical protein [Amycolatopsis thermoflava]|uniref:hypothetical protein n=1 Tax=Amycolatopsis thermoflava TaxID=84480 RepID=UPI00364D9C23